MWGADVARCMAGIGVEHSQQSDTDNGAEDLGDHEAG
jgi:hypothetical protein